MSRTIELPDDVYARVEEAASASGNSVAEVIAARFPTPATPQPSENGSEQASVNGTGPSAGEHEFPRGTADTRTMADRLAGRIGTVRSGRGDLSERGRELVIEGLLEKKRTGHL